MKTKLINAIKRFRPQHKPKLGQVLIHIESGTSLMVQGITGDVSVSPGYAKGMASALARAMPEIANLVSRIEYKENIVLLSGDVSYPQTPWPPKGWEIDSIPRRVAKKIRGRGKNSPDPEVLSAKLSELH